MLDTVLYSQGSANFTLSSLVVVIITMIQFPPWKGHGLLQPQLSPWISPWPTQLEHILPPSS